MSYSGKLYVNGQWLAGSGETFTSMNPATGEVVWRGNSAGAEEINQAVAAARAAAFDWAAKPAEERVEIIRKFQSLIEAGRETLAGVLSQETGKVLWDSRGEISAMIGKLSFSLQALAERAGTRFGDGAGFTTALRHKPHGVVAVYGPYNFPAHLPNGHIVPALLAGNAVIFKPSELSPLIAEKTIECWEKAGIPKGVISLIQGERETGKLLSAHPGLDGLFFTGSSATGKILHKQFSDTPQKILALELGGNNPLVVHEVADKQAAAYWTVQSAYQTSGQRCTCARRLIVPRGAGNDAFTDTLIKMVKSIQVGSYDETPEPYMGPLISNVEADKLLAAQETLAGMGGKILVKMERLREGKPFISPGLIDVTGVKKRLDTEWFGPLLQLSRVPDMEAAMIEANNTQYGLSSGIFSDKREHYEFFLKRIRAGVVNWNRPLTGSSGNLPFGGVGLSGNNRPAAYYAADYCAYPVASNEAEKLTIPAQPTAGIGSLLEPA